MTFIGGVNLGNEVYVATDSLMDRRLVPKLHIAKDRALAVSFDGLECFRFLHATTCTSSTHAYPDHWFDSCGNISCYNDLLGQVETTMNQGANLRSTIALPVVGYDPNRNLLRVVVCNNHNPLEVISEGNTWFTPAANAYIQGIVKDITDLPADQRIAQLQSRVLGELPKNGNDCQDCLMTFDPDLRTLKVVARKLAGSHFEPVSFTTSS